VRFMFPYSVRWPCRAVRCGRRPDDPAAAFVTVSPRPPPVPGRLNHRGDPVRSGRVAGRAPALAVFRLCPPRRPLFPCRRGSGTGSNGSCTAAPSRPVFRYPREPSHGLAGVPRIAAPAALLGFSPFAALFPPAGVAAFPPLGPTCRFPGHVSRRFLRCDGLVGPSGRLPPGGEGDRRPRVTGRGSWASSPRAVRSAPALSVYRRGRCRPGLCLSRVFGRRRPVPRDVV
jgi:hypothetical protein